MSQYQWKWQKVDKPGVWAFGGEHKDKPPRLPGDAAIIQQNMLDDMKLRAYDGWRVYLGPIPDIAPPEPELRLPEGWTGNVVKWSEAWATKAYLHENCYIEIWHHDKTTAIRAAQAAVDELEKQ